jgi:hypothetical protein
MLLLEVVLLGIIKVNSSPLLLENSGAGNGIPTKTKLQERS